MPSPESNLHNLILGRLDDLGGQLSDVREDVTAVRVSQARVEEQLISTGFRVEAIEVEQNDNNKSVSAVAERVAGVEGTTNKGVKAAGGGGLVALLYMVWNEWLRGALGGGG